MGIGAPTPSGTTFLLNGIKMNSNDLTFINNGKGIVKLKR